MRRRPVSGRAVAAMAILGAAEVLLIVAAWRLGRGPAAAGHDPVAARLSVAAALQAPETRGFARALAPRPFVFPADHGPHPDFRTEWWYYTGNLAARDGRRFGFQLTFFRTALAPPSPPGRTSAWATRQVYFAHFALTDVAGRRFHAYERWERQALGLAGAEAAPFRVWVGDWSAAAAGPAVAGTPPMRLRAAAGGASGSGGESGATDIYADAGLDAAAGSAPALDLVLTSPLAPVAQGDRGLSPKSAAPGNASYYYSLPRMAAAGRIRLGSGGETIAVTGLAWMDREWSTSSLAAGEVGWDWFALQLDDGWEVMLYRLRRRSAAAADPASRATLIAPDGRTTLFSLDALRLSETAHWTSPASRVRYPAGWRLTLPAGAGSRLEAGSLAAAADPGDLDLTLVPLLADQELPLSLRYWEGAVAATGSHGSHPVTARGYVELTGYEPPPPTR